MDLKIYIKYGLLKLGSRRCEHHARDSQLTCDKTSSHFKTKFYLLMFNTELDIHNLLVDFTFLLFLRQSKTQLTSFDACTGNWTWIELNLWTSNDHGTIVFCL